MEILKEIIFYIGLIWLIFILLKAIYLIYICLRNYVFARYCFKINFKKKYGEWAVVTGCTQGIGLSYCKELAERGINIIMISLFKDELDTVSEKLEKDYKIQTKTIQADFSETIELYHRLENELKDYNIGILVNNVGVAVPYPMKFIEMTEKNLWDHLSVNMVSATMMTYMILPGMMQRKKGAIINIASIASTAPIPLISVYAATKAYVARFTRGLQLECKNTGVTIQAILPSFVNTALLASSPKAVSSYGFLVPTPDAFVKSAITLLGVDNFTSGYFIHGYQFLLFMIVPEWLFIKVSEILLTRGRREYDENHTTEQI